MKALTAQAPYTDLTAHEIRELLAQRHGKDVFVAECKNGPTWGAEHLRMDAWVMRRSWTQMCITGYEVKISHQDFIQDQKWHRYLDYCNEFCFVCPWGLIQPEELPADVGLLWASKNLTRLHTKRRPTFRRVSIPETVWMYVLMCRAKIVDGDQMQGLGPVDPRERWRDWLAKKAEDRELGYSVSKAVRNHVGRADEARRHAECLVATYERVRTLIASLGMDPDKIAGEYDHAYWNTLRRRLVQVIPPELEKAADDAARALDSLRSNLREFRKEAQK